MIVDADDRILSCNRGWDAFARANGAPALAGAALIGTPLLDFITGKVTRAFTQTLLARVRVSGRPLILPYRCDSSNERRFMRMVIVSLAGGGVRLRHWLLKTEPLEQWIPLETAMQRGRETFIRCSLCNLIKQGDAWLEPALLVRQRRLRPTRPWQ